MTVAACAQGRGKAEVTINGKAVSIDYGRPELKGRDMLGKATPGTIWRFGSNSATVISSTGDLDIAGTVLKAGKYSLWAKKTADGWLLMFHPQTGIWGLPVKTDGFVAQLPLAQSSAGSSVEQFTVTLSNVGGKAQLKVEWGTAVLTGSFGVS
jgi:hypothetical protein